MKSFLLSIPERLKRGNDALDAKAILCGRSWEVFNNEGIKQVWIFKEDGSLMISTKGDVVCSSWEYLSINQSILIKVDGNISMFRPAFVDDVVLAMKKDGTEEYVCMIDEKNSSMFPNRKLDELQSYFAEKEKKVISQEREISRQLAIKEKEKEKAIFVEQTEKEAIKEIISANKQEIQLKRNILTTLQSVILAITPICITAIIFSYKDKPSLIAIIILTIIFAFVIFVYAIAILNVPSQVKKRAIKDKKIEISYVSDNEILEIYRNIVNKK